MMKFDKLGRTQIPTNYFKFVPYLENEKKLMIIRYKNINDVLYIMPIKENLDENEFLYCTFGQEEKHRICIMKKIPEVFISGDLVVSSLNKKNVLCIIKSTNP